MNKLGSPLPLHILVGYKANKRQGDMGVKSLRGSLP
jgi:hypothetical protein